MAVRESFSTSSALIDGVIHQDPAAWKRFTALYGPLVYYWGRELQLSPEDAADLTQDVFHTLWKRIGQYSTGNFRGWLLTVTKNQFRDRYRKQRLDPVARGGSDAQGLLREIPDPLDGSSSEEDPQDKSERVLLYRALELIRGDFSEETWHAFWQMAIENEPAATIASRLGITESSVRHAKFRVLKRLREELNPTRD